MLKADDKESQEIIQLVISPYNTPESIVNFVSDSFIVCESKIVSNPSINGTKILLPLSGLKISKSQEQKCELYIGIKKGIIEGTQIKFALEKVVIRGETSGSQKEISVSGIYTKNAYKYTQSKLLVSVPSSGISMPQSPQKQAEIFSFSASLLGEKNAQIQGFRIVVD